MGPQSRLTTISGKTGLAPGSLVHVGRVHQTSGRMTAIDYCRDTFEEREVHSIEDILPFRDRDSVTWVNVEGMIDIGFIEKIGQHFNIHPLVLEDILNTNQRPKLEEHEDFLYLTLKHIFIEPQDFDIYHEQISILVCKDFVFTFRERSDELLGPLRHRLISNKGRLRAGGTDYLTYVILDNIVDNYFSLQDTLDEMLESIEDDLLANPSPATLEIIQRVKRELIFIRRSVSPLREMLTELLHSDSPLIQEKMHLYFRDVLDHAIRVLEAIDSYRDLVTGMLDVYLSSVSNKMNEIMKVLTVFASIFIPLTFIAGIYGMNFEYMPELKLKWAYPALWIVFVAIPIIILGYFRRKKWL